MTTRLSEVMEAAGLGDAQLASECGLLRGQIYAYRKGKKLPGYENATAIIAALKKRSITMDLADLCTRQKKGKRPKAA